MSGIRKAKTMVDDHKEDIVAMKKQIAQLEEQISLLNEEAALRKDAMEIQIRNPTVIKPNYAFEQTADWEEHLKQEWMLTVKKTLRQINAMKEDAENQIEAIKKEIAKGEY